MQTKASKNITAVAQELVAVAKMLAADEYTPEQLQEQEKWMDWLTSVGFGQMEIHFDLGYVWVQWDSGPFVSLGAKVFTTVMTWEDLLGESPKKLEDETGMKVWELVEKVFTKFPRKGKSKSGILYKTDKFDEIWGGGSFEYVKVGHDGLHMKIWDVYIDGETDRRWDERVREDRRDD